MVIKNLLTVRRFWKFGIFLCHKCLRRLSISNEEKTLQACLDRLTHQLQILQHMQVENAWRIRDKKWNKFNGWKVLGVGPSWKECPFNKVAYATSIQYHVRSQSAWHDDQGSATLDHRKIWIRFSRLTVCKKTKLMRLFPSSKGARFDSCSIYEYCTSNTLIFIRIYGYYVDN